MTHPGDFGEDLSCPELMRGPNWIVEGECGSGSDPDCGSNAYHKVSRGVDFNHNRNDAFLRFAIGDEISPLHKQLSIFDPPGDDRKGGNYFHTWSLNPSVRTPVRKTRCNANIGASFVPL